MSLNYRGLFEGWEIAVAKKLVSDYQRNWPLLRREGFDDLLQECLTYWLKEKAGYDSTREASQKTFMGKVVRNFLSDFADKVCAQKRKLLYETESLDEYFDESENSVSDNKKYEPYVIKDNSIGIDISIAFQKLTPDQRAICEMLRDEDLSPLEISKHLKKHHSYVYREIGRIRQIFEKQGLKGYLTEI